jgi:hypothetical protein
MNVRLSQPEAKQAQLISYLCEVTHFLEGEGFEADEALRMALLYGARVNLAWSRDICAATTAMSIARLLREPRV